MHIIQVNLPITNIYLRIVLLQLYSPHGQLVKETEKNILIYISPGSQVA